MRFYEYSTKIPILGSHLLSHHGPTLTAAHRHAATLEFVVAATFYVR
jgi:hypothetical protein